MNRLSKEKRNQLVLICLVFAGVLGGFYVGLIRYQQDARDNLANRRGDAAKKLTQVRDAIRNSKEIEAELAVVSRKLEQQEESMASGDLYSWMIISISNFKQRYPIDIPQLTAGTLADMNLIPRFPYKQFTVTITGTAYYHDLGKFVADFENQFPTSRILNLELSPSPGEGADEREKLSFRMEIVALVKPGPPRPANLSIQ